MRAKGETWIVGCWYRFNGKNWRGRKQDIQTVGSTASRGVRISIRWKD